MGNSSSAPENEKRPSLKGLNSSSTIKASDRQSSASSTSLPDQTSASGRRRKSIELPDLDGSLAFTAATPQPPNHPSWAQGSDWKGKAKAVPPTASRGTSFDGPNDSKLPLARQGEDVLLGPNQSDHLGSSFRARSPIVSDDRATHPGDLSTDTEADETDLDTEAWDPLHPIPLPRNTATISSILQPDIPDHMLSSAKAANDSLPPVSAGGISALPPLHPPHHTIVAPIAPTLPLGTGASATTSLIMGSPLPSVTSTPIASPQLSDANVQRFSAVVDPAALAPIPTPEGEPAEDAAGLGLPASIEMPPLPSPLPAAAPLQALAGDLFRNPEAVEAVKAATVDLGAGPEGVPTLLTWTPGEGEGKEGGPSEGASAPQQVYVTGTFAKGWTTKIELRKKKSQPDFSALVNLPPGPHRLKFIVDTQWKTSKNLPSGTDQEGNLINYLQVSKTDVGMNRSDSHARVQKPEDAERYWREEAQWTSEIPKDLVAFGEAAEAEEAAFEAQEEHNRRLAAQGLPPDPMPRADPHAMHAVPPPSLPAQLQRGVLNQSSALPVGSGDDNSILSKPDHTVIDHLAAAPISKGLLSVAVTKRYRRKFVTTVFYKPVPVGLT